MVAKQAVFLLLALVAALASIGVVTAKSPVRSALCLVLNFFVLAFIYFTLNSTFIGAAQIMVYAGAIMVLFLFVIMLLSREKQAEEEKSRDPKKWLALILAVAMGAGVLSQVLTPLINHPILLADSTKKYGPTVEYGSPEAIGWILPTTYALPLMAVGVLLLIGTVGSILLAKRKL
jgi:NADH-quinone oxidoreductase subunit J